MNKITFIALSLLFSSHLSGQILVEDSMLNVVGYWALHDQQTYDANITNYKLTGSDTTEKEFTTYEIDIVITDSTAENFIIEWTYKDIKVESENELSLKLFKILEGVTFKVKTNEMGTVEGLENWEEVQKKVNKALTPLMEEFGENPIHKQTLAQIKSTYSSQVAIETLAIKDIQQFYSFHGGGYTLGEKISSPMKMPNGYGGDPFDVDLTLMLTDLDLEEDYGIIAMHQSVNVKQLTDAAYTYLEKAGMKLPARETFPKLANDTWITNQIHGDSGWIISSVKTQEVASQGKTQIEARLLTLK